MNDTTTPTDPSPPSPDLCPIEPPPDKPVPPELFRKQPQDDDTNPDDE